MGDKVIVFCAFTRRWAVERWIEGFEALDYPKHLISLAFIIDCDEPLIYQALRRLGARGYRTWKIEMNEQFAPNEVRINARRLRIADIKNQSKALIKDLEGEFVLGFEDDTVFTNPQTIQHLLAPFRELPNIGYVEGVQCGRWGEKMVGAWIVDDLEYPTRAETILPPEGNQNVLGSIDGGGFYGYATRKHHYLDHEYFWSGQPWGPDVNYGLWLRRQMFNCLIDWGLVFGHNDHNALLFPDGSITKVVYNLDNITNQWGRLQ